MKGGAIQNIINVILQFQDHSGCTVFMVTNLGKHKMSSGYPWLHDHNSEVNWQIQEVTLSQCPAQCHTCKTELQEQWREEAKVLAGPTLQMVEEDDELEDTDDSEHGKPLLEPGDCLLTMILTPTIPASGSHCHHDHISEAGREGPVEHTHEGERPGSPIPL